MADIDLRRQVLEKAADIISGSRHEQYGGAEDSFTAIARYWNVHLLNSRGIDAGLNAVDVALMMDLLKTARLDTNPSHEDSWVDKGGYIGCGYEIAMTLDGLAAVLGDLDALDEEEDDR